MSLSCVVGKGKQETASASSREAAETCRARLGGCEPDFLLLFSSALFPQEEVVRTIRAAFPSTPLMGCSTAGEIYNEGPDKRSVALVAFTGIKVHPGLGGLIAQDALAAGQVLGRQLNCDPGRVILLFNDALAGDGAGILRGLQERMGPRLPLVGGAAGDNSMFQQTHVYWNDSIHSGTAVGACLDGDFVFGLGVRHGWEPIGLPFRVTKSKGNRLMEINGLPAFKLYDEYFGQYTDRLRNHPFGRLAVHYPLGYSVPNSEEFLLRAPLAVEPNGTILCVAEVPEGASVRLMIGSVEGALQAARIAAMEALSQMQGRLPKLALVFTGIARRTLLGPRAAEETAVIRDILGAQVPIVGFNTYGEIAPLEGIHSNPSCFHNETVVIFTLA